MTWRGVTAQPVAAGSASAKPAAGHTIVGLYRAPIDIVAGARVRRAIGRLFDAVEVIERSFAVGEVLVVDVEDIAVGAAVQLVDAAKALDAVCPTAAPQIVVAAVTKEHVLEVRAEHRLDRRVVAQTEL